MGYTRIDKEARKFDDDGNIKVSIEVDNAGIGGGGGAASDVTVDNTAANPVPVSLVNADATTDLEVAVNGNVSIDDSTPIDVTVNNAYQFVYDMVYDGSTWRFQASDSNGKSINLDHTYYTTAEITALGSSTDFNLWLAAYNDGMLIYKYVDTYEDEHEKETYLTHPSLGDDNKCLKLIYNYSEENSVKVVKSVHINIADWTFDSTVAGAISISKGAVTSPDPNSSIAVGTDICTITATVATGGITLSLTGADAANYRLANVTDGTTGASLAYDAAKTFVVETAADFSGSSYDHNITVTATSDLYSTTASTAINTTGTVGAAFANDKYIALAASTGLAEIDVTAFQLTADFSSSCWYKGTDTTNSHTTCLYPLSCHGSGEGYASFSQKKGLHLQVRTGYVFLVYGAAYVYMTLSDWSDMTDDNWHNVVITWDYSESGHTTGNISAAHLIAGTKVYLDGTDVSNYGLSGSSEPLFDIDRINVGRNVSGTGAPAGDWDEVAYWAGHVLTPTEVTNLYNSGTVTDLENTTGLTAPTKYMRFEDAGNQDYETIAEADGGTVTDGTTTAY